MTALSTGTERRPREVDLVNVAILLRRPMLVTGRPGTGKSTLAYGVAYELPEPLRPDP